MKSTYFANVSSECYHAGYTDDGEAYIAECYFVSISNEAGRRFCHTVGFNGVVRETCKHNGDYFVSCREEALVKAERLAARVNNALAAGVALDFSFWREIDPVYGSKEYQRQGIEAERAELDKQAA